MVTPTDSQSRLVEHLIALSGSSSSHFPSVLLHGPPGSGKRTIARLAAESWGLEFIEIPLVGSLEAVRHRLIGTRKHSSTQSSNDSPPGDLGRCSGSLVYFSQFQFLPPDLDSLVLQLLTRRKYDDPMGRTWELAPDTWIVAGLTLDPRSEARIDPFGPLAAAFRHRVPILLPDNPAELCQIATQIVGEFGESPVLESTVLDVLPAHCSQTVSLHTLRNWLENSLRLAHTAPTITRKHFETAMIEDLDWAIRQLSFRGMDLDRDHVLRWMEGFDLPLQALALSLIRVIQSNYYLDLTRYFGELRGLMAKSNIPRGSSVVFCKWQPEGKSAPHIAHDLRIEGYWKVKFDIDFTKKDFEKLEGLQRTRPYWFILSDDLVGTGNTLCRMLEEPSSPVYELLDFFPKGQVRLLILAGFEQGLRRARQAILRSRHRGRLEVIVGRLYQDRDRCFHPTSTIFPRKDQRDQFQEFCLKTAQHKMKLHEDYWLGYEQSEALVVFYNRVPNNSLPVLWCSRNWFPLFVQSQDK